MKSKYLRWAVDRHGCARRLTLFQRAHRAIAMLLGVSALCLAVSCTNEDGARNALESMGMTEIKIGGHDFFGCSKDDTSCTEFTATNPAGKRVHGSVGCGIGCGKNCTVRFE